MIAVAFSNVHRIGVACWPLRDIIIEEGTLTPACQSQMVWMSAAARLTLAARAGTLQLLLTDIKTPLARRRLCV